MRAAAVRHRGAHAEAATILQRQDPHRRHRTGVRADLDGASAAQRDDRLHDRADGIDDGPVLPAHAVREHSRARQKETWGEPFRLAEMDGHRHRVVRPRHGDQGIDGDRADRRGALRPDLRVRFDEGGAGLPQNPLHRPGRDVGRAGRDHVALAAFHGRRRNGQPDHVRAESGADDRALSLAHRLAAIAGRRLRPAAAGSHRGRDPAGHADPRAHRRDHRGARPPARGWIPRHNVFSHARADVERGADPERGGCRAQDVFAARGARGSCRDAGRTCRRS